MTRLLAIVLTAVLLGPLSLGGQLFHCRWDGQTRVACCCDGESAEGDASNRTAQVDAGSCCDVLVQAAPVRDASRIDPPAGLAHPPLVALLPKPTYVAVPGQRPPCPSPRWNGPPRPGRSLLLQRCSLLI